MRFIIVNVADKTVTVEDHRDLDDAKRAAGLKPKETDHGSFGRGFGYVVYEYGLFDPTDQARYCRAGNTLISGNMVVYAYDEMGETIDVSDDAFKAFAPNVAFFVDANEVETAIKRGIVRRPHMVRGDEVLWQWPQPKPEFMSDDDETSADGRPAPGGKAVADPAD